MWALVDSNNRVVNKIVFEPGSNYTPPPGLTLREVERWVDIGMDADIREQDIPIPPQTEDRRGSRDRYYQNDLSMVALFVAAKEKDPLLNFSTYLDQLEALRGTIIVP